MADPTTVVTEVVAKFEIPYTQFLNEEGIVTQTLPIELQEPAYLLKLYRMMMLTRLFDQKAISLQRTGKLGTYPSALGHEALGVGIGAAMGLSDVFCPYYRDQGTQLWRGVKMEEILLYWGGDERGSKFSGPVKDFPICVPIASQTLHAVGVALGIKLQKQPRAVVTTIGDGGTSRGDFYEAMNAAGAFGLPVVFVINNNSWAISVPRSQQTHAETLAQKGIAAGIESVQVDGNDIFAVLTTVKAALEKARKTSQPTVIEAITYRMGDHTTADDASRYRSAEEVKAWQAKDPMSRFKSHLMSRTIWHEEREKALIQNLGLEIQQAVDHYEKKEPESPTVMLDYLYAKLPTIYEEQRLALQRLGERGDVNFDPH